MELNILRKAYCIIMFSIEVFYMPVLYEFVHFLIDTSYTQAGQQSNRTDWGPMVGRSIG